VFDYSATIASAATIELRNLIQVADLIVRSAQGRRESRVLHYTLDIDSCAPMRVTLLYRASPIASTYCSRWRKLTNSISQITPQRCVVPP
jgi:succinate dehydrogenase/fumarate reductase flavoprotein subunit